MTNIFNQQPPPTVGARVWLVVDPDKRVRQHVGTVHKLSPAGYLHVRWDGATKVTEVFSPDTWKCGRIKVVTGDDALPRHDWYEVLYVGDADVRCARCNVFQSDENEFAACFGSDTDAE